MVRFKARHILCEVLYQNDRRQGVTVKDMSLMKALKAVLKQLHGDYGLSYTLRYNNLNVCYLNNETNIVLIRCKRGFHNLVQSCLPFVKRINDEDVMLRTLHLSGTIRSAKKFLVKHHKAKLPKLLRECGNPDERMKVQALIAESCQECEHKLQMLETFRAKPKS